MLLWQQVGLVCGQSGAMLLRTQSRPFVASWVVCMCGVYVCGGRGVLSEIWSSTSGCGCDSQKCVPASRAKVLVLPWGVDGGVCVFVCWQRPTRPR